MTIVAGAACLLYGLRLLLRPPDPRGTARASGRMHKVASAPAPAIIAAGAALANPGIFMLIAAKSISQLNPSTVQYVLDWVLFTFVALLPLAIAVLMLLIAPRVTHRGLVLVRGWIERHGQTLVAIILIALAASLLRDGIVGLTRAGGADTRSRALSSSAASDGAETSSRSSSSC